MRSLQRTIDNRTLCGIRFRRGNAHDVKQQLVVFALSVSAEVQHIEDMLLDAGCQGRPALGMPSAACENISASAAKSRSEYKPPGI